MERVALNVINEKWDRRLVGGKERKKNKRLGKTIFIYWERRRWKGNNDRRWLLESSAYAGEGVLV